MRLNGFNSPENIWMASGGVGLVLVQLVKRHGAEVVEPVSQNSKP